MVTLVLITTSVTVMRLVMALVCVSVVLLETVMTTTTVPMIVVMLLLVVIIPTTMPTRVTWATFVKPTTIVLQALVFLTLPPFVQIKPPNVSSTVVIQCLHNAH
jgi:hypothetical protein